MDKAKKFLRKLSNFQQDKIDEILFKIESSNTKDLDIKKLKGHTNLFRVRIGDIRVVFFQDNDIIKVLFIGKRGDSKYTKL